jgi:hypothetical protein
MAGAGVLPARAAAEARRQGWQVVAFRFDDAPGIEAASDAVVPSRITEIQAVLTELVDRRVEAALFVGKLRKQTAFAEVDSSDEAGRRLGSSGLSDGALGEMVIATLGAMGITVLDQRPFLAPWIVGSRALGAAVREPSAAEWEEIREGLALAREMARWGVGQTIVRARGVTVAVEAAEGTDETIQRGARLAGPGAVVVKAVAPGHDYRFDVPAIGVATLETMRAGGATALAVERDKVVLLDHDDVVRIAAAAGIAVVGVGDDG